MSATDSSTILSSTEEPTTPPVSLWRNRDYLLLWGGQMVSSVGSRISLVALPLLLLLLTHSPAQAGLVAALRTIPYVVLMLPAGALIDRWNRKRVMAICDGARMLALASVPLAMATGHLSLAQVCVVALVDGVGQVFFGSAYVSALPRVVPHPQLAHASAQDQLMDSLAWLLGPALGGVLFGLAPGLPFLADALSYACSVVTLLGVRRRLQGERSARPVTVRGLYDETRAGLDWLWREPVLRFLALLTGVLMTSVAGYSLIVILVAQRLHASDATIGLILGAGGIGGVLGAVITVPLRRRFGFRRVLVWSTWAWALTWPPFVFAPNPFLMGITIAVSFLCVPVYMATQMSYRLAVIPDEMRGRVASVFRLIAFGSTPIGLALSGVLLQRFGPVVTVLVTFVPQVALAVVASCNRALRRQVSL